MSITIEYEPDKGLLCNNISIPWGAPRDLIRKQLKGQYEVHDLEFDGTFSRRDIYKILACQPVIVFFNYSNEDRFSEFEIHGGVKFVINGRILDFESNFYDVINQLDQISITQKMVDEGEALYVDLKLSLSSC